MNRERIAGAGNVYLDIVARGFPSEDFTPNKLMVGKESRTIPGGSVVTFARTCASLGLQTMVVGKIGKDPTGRVLEELLNQETNVTPLLITAPGVSTNIGVHAVRNDGEEIRINFGTANQALTSPEIQDALKDYIPQTAYFYLGGVLKQPLLLSELRGLVESLRGQGIKILLDHGRVSNDVSKGEIDRLKELIPYVDYYLPSHEEFLQVWESSTIEEAVQKVRAISSSKLVIKDGENGAIGVGSNGELLRVPSFPVQVIDTVGAGDTFNAGFLKAQTMDLFLEESIIFANATSAYKISHPDSETPTVEQVSQLINKPNDRRGQVGNTVNPTS